MESVSDEPGRLADRNGFGYLEEYDGCACCSVEFRKKDLLGYCKFHGGSRKRGSTMRIQIEKGDPLGSDRDHK